MANFFPGQEMLTVVAAINLLFFIGVPLVAVAIGVSRLAFRTRMGKGWRIGMGLLWLINAVSLFAVGGTLAREFTVHREMTQEIPTEDFVSDTVKVGFYKIDEIEEKQFHFGPNTIPMPAARTYIRIKKSEDGLWRLEQNISARGRSIDEANELAATVAVPLQMEKGSLLIPKSIPFTELPKWRAQEINYTLYVPEGAHMTFDETFPYRSQGVFHHGPNTFWKHPTAIYQMDAEGLHCLTCPAAETEEVEEMKAEEGLSGDELGFQDFETLLLQGKMKVNIEQGDEFSVQLAGEDQYQDQVEINQDGVLLSVRSNVDQPGSPIRVYITMPTLRQLDISEAEDVWVDGFETDQLTINASGAFELKTDVKCDVLKLVLEDHSEFEFTGQANFLEATLRDHARLDTDRGTVTDTKLDLADNSLVKITNAVSVIEQQVDESSRIRIVD